MRPAASGADPGQDRDLLDADDGDNGPVGANSD